MFLALMGTDVPPTRSGDFTSGSPYKPVLLRGKCRGLPKFLGNPIVFAPCSSTPARPFRQAVWTVGYGLRLWQQPQPSRVMSLEVQSHGSSTRCLRFAAHGRPYPRKTRFRLVANLCRTGLTTRWVPKGVSDSCHVMMSSPPTRLSWRTARHILIVLATA